MAGLGPLPDAELIAIRFSPGWSARAVVVAPDADGAGILARLGVPPAKAVLAVTGGTAEGTATPALAAAFVDGVGRTIIEEGWTAVTGATDAGVFTLLGRAAEAAGRPPPAPWIGVAPLDLVRWPGGPPRPEAETHPLEPHHSHFVLVEGDEWGDETPAQLAVTAALGAGGAPSAVVIAGGGAIARGEIVGHARAGRPILVLRGSGRLADDLAGVSGAGEDLRAIVPAGELVTVDVDAGPAAIRAALAELLAR